MKKVLFICKGNTCRSQMAKGFFNTFTSSQSSDSAGVNPGTRVNPKAVIAMKEIGIDISRYTPKMITKEMEINYDLFVTMGCTNECPLTPKEKTIIWQIEDPFGKSLHDYRKIRDTIRHHVEHLIEQIKQQEKKEEMLS